MRLIKKAKNIGYKITLVYFWLSSFQEAKQRVAIRVSNGGHHIPEETVERRYYRGLNNLHHLYLPICNFWIIINNTTGKPEFVAEGESDQSKIIYNNDIWNIMKNQSNENQA